MYVCMYVCMYMFIPLAQQPNAGQGPPPIFKGSKSHTIQTAVGRTSLDEGSARRRDLYLTTHKSEKRYSCLRRDSNLQSQQAIGPDRRLRPLGHRDRQLE